MYVRCGCRLESYTEFMKTLKREDADPFYKKQLELIKEKFTSNY